MKTTIHKNQIPAPNLQLKRATVNDRDVVVNILCTSFGKDPHISWMLQKSEHPYKLKILMEYIFDKTIRIGDIYLTPDHSAVALWKSEKKEKYTFEYLVRNVRIFLNLRLSSILRILKNERFTYRQYPKGQPYYHLYLIGVLPGHQGKGLASKLLNPVLDEMTKKHIPVYLETANVHNVMIYEHKGFKVYNSWFQPGLNLYFMRKLV